MKKALTILMLAILVAVSMKAQNNDQDKIARHINRAEVCIEMNHIDDAIKEYEDIVNIAPSWPNVYMYLGNTFALKGDDVSLRKAIENYKKFMQLADDKDLYSEAQDKLSRIEMTLELKAKEEEKTDNMLGTWKSEYHDKYTGRPWFIIEISKTDIPNKFQILLSPKSMMYDNIVNDKAYTELIDGQINWSYTFKETYIPSQSSYNLAGVLVNSMFSSGSIGNMVGNAFVETARENDVEYTNIKDFVFVVDADVRNDKYNQYGEGYLQGSCQMRGEHNEAGRNSVEADSVGECCFIKGADLYPVFEKITKIGSKYYYGDIKLTSINKVAIIGSSPYISKEEFDLEVKKNSQLSLGFAIPTGIALGYALGGTIFRITEKIIDGDDRYDDTFFDKIFKTKYLVAGGVVGGALAITWGVLVGTHWNKYLRQCYAIHNEQVDENIKKYGKQDKTSVSVNVGMTPTGIGVSLNF